MSPTITKQVVKEQRNRSVQIWREQAEAAELDAVSADDYSAVALLWADVMASIERIGGFPAAFVRDFERCTAKARKLAEEAQPCEYDPYATKARDGHRRH